MRATPIQKICNGCARYKNLYRTSLGAVWAERHRALGHAVRQLHRHTWFSTEGLAGAVEVATGTLAGSSLGDAVFTLAMTRVLAKLRRALAHAGRATTVEVAPGGTLGAARGVGVLQGDPTSVTLHEVSFVDDVAIPVLGEADALLARISEVASIADAVFAGLGLVLNFAPGKSEAVVRFPGGRGRGRPPPAGRGPRRVGPFRAGVWRPRAHARVLGL